MVRSQLIYQKAMEIRRRYASDSMDDIASALGIQVVERSDFTDLLGMYIYKWRHRFIFLNAHLDDNLRQLVLAHEIGHDMFHRPLAVHGLQEFTLFDMRGVTEYEANAFGAHLLLDDEEILQMAHDGLDIAEMARLQNTNINLMLIKMQEMSRLGYEFHNLPFCPRGDFLKKVKI